jgi:hypothetical protein
MSHPAADEKALTLLGEIKTRLPDPPVMVVTAYDDDERRHYPSASRRVSR